MDFELDKQTIQDLEIFGNEKSVNSIFRIYNYTKTIGGRKYLYELMHSPLTEINKIQQRRDTIKFFYDTEFEMTINSGQFDFIEHYLNLNISVLRNNFLDAYVQYVSDILKPLNDYYIIQTGIQQFIFLIKHLEEKLKSIINFKLPKELDNQIRQIHDFFEHQDIREILTTNGKISCVRLNRFDNLFRKKYKKELNEIIHIIYTFDSFISIAKAARINRFSFPEYLSSPRPIITITGLFHPFIENAVPYNVDFDELFRGTNVKDAFDASLIIIKSFAKITNCSFLISTHITEVAEEIKNIENIQFMYFDSDLVDDKPIYSYKILSGVSHERLGMLIVKNEKIIEILNSISDN